MSGGKTKFRSKITGKYTLMFRKNQHIYKLKAVKFPYNFFIVSDNIFVNFEG